MLICTVLNIKNFYWWPTWTTMYDKVLNFAKLRLTLNFFCFGFPSLLGKTSTKKFRVTIIGKNRNVPNYCKVFLFPTTQPCDGQKAKYSMLPICTMGKDIISYTGNGAHKSYSLFKTTVERDHSSKRIQSWCIVVISEWNIAVFGVVQITLVYCRYDMISIIHW